MKVLHLLSYLVRFRDFLMRQRVAVGFFFAGVFLGIAEPTEESMGLGIVIVVLGEAIRTWASGYIQKGKRLARYGPYAHIRHPLYSGSFIMGLGICVCGGSTVFLALYIVFFATVYLGIIRSEEKHMQETFGSEFVSYAKNVPLFLPRLAAWTFSGSASYPRADGSKFQWGRVWKNKEYQAWTGLAGVTALLYLKLLALV